MYFNARNIGSFDQQTNTKDMQKVQPPIKVAIDEESHLRQEIKEIKTKTNNTSNVAKLVISSWIVLKIR